MELDDLDAGLARLHRHLALLGREVQQARSDYRRLLELNRLHLENSRPPEGTLDRLSQQERRVATLVANGLSNHQVAAELHVTVHTVKTQVGSILRKLELRSRWELDYLFRRDLAQYPTSATTSATPMT